MSVIDSKDYIDIVNVFKRNKNSFGKRKREIKEVTFSKINWSEAFLDFTPLESILNQLKSPKIYSKEKASSIKNHYLEDKLVYSLNIENENWGSVFISYEKGHKTYFQFDENFDDEMELRQLKLVYHNSKKISKSLYYSFNTDTNQETFMVDLYDYNEDDTIKKITRNGFYNKKSNILEPREFSFSYLENKMQIISSMKGLDGEKKEAIIYDDKIPPPR